MLYRLVSTFAQTGILLFLLFPTSAFAQGEGDQQAEKYIASPDVESQYPLKTESLIYTKEEVIRAREKIQSNRSARRLADRIVAAAEKWAEWSDEDLAALIPDGSVPRAFDLNANGCPVHGDTVFNVGGSYPWILDPRKQYEVECPIGHETYPSNDFDPSVAGEPLQAQPGAEMYVDNGWGWEAENGEKYWFVAYANQWFYRNYVHSALSNLGRAYLLTGRPAFAHKALVMLHRLAEVYPGMDYEHQSRYGQMQKQNGGRYPGKVVNRIWETSFIRAAAECYDAVWSHIEKDRELAVLLGKEAKEIQAFIEVHLLEEAVESYHKRKIQGNFGMHQMALLYVLLARQHLDNDHYIDQIIHNVSKEYLHTGISYALYNFVFRDGVPMESPSYNFLWIRTLAALNDRLKKFGVNFFEDARFQDVLRSPIYTMGTEKYTIDVGDSGSTLGGVIGRDQNTYEIAYANTGDPGFLAWIYPGQSKIDQEKHKVTYESLFRPEIKITQPLDQSNPGYNSSRLLAGYGLGKLASGGDDPNVVALTYGLHGSHYHWDFLNFELFAFGQKMMPDFGYPDAMNTYVPGVYTWSQNTVAHNTVVVDSRRQQRNLPGDLHHFADGEFARSISASSPAYAQASRYRRNLISVDAGPDQNYLVDIFYVKGGNRHDYILHGPPGYASVQEDEWSKPFEGTYAGEEVGLAEIYDNSRMNDPDYSGGYGGYSGSGFQHLFNVRKKTGGLGIVDFRHVKDQQARLKIRILEDANQEIYLADAYNHPRSKEFKVKHLISRSESPDNALANAFVSVIEPYYGESFIHSVRKLPVEGGAGSRAVFVDRGNEMDIVISDFENVDKTIGDYPVQTDAITGMVTLDREGQLKRVFFSDGNYLTYGDQKFEAQHLTGEVTKVDVRNRQVEIQLEDRPTDSGLEHVNTEVMYFQSGALSTAHPIRDHHIEGNKLYLTTTDDLLIGRINVTRIAGESQVVQVNNSLRFSSMYIGAWLLNDSFETVGKVTGISGGKLTFSGSEGEIFLENEVADVWVATIGVGDRAEWKSQFEWEASTQPRGE